MFNYNTGRRVAVMMRNEWTCVVNYNILFMSHYENEGLLFLSQIANNIDIFIVKHHKV